MDTLQEILNALLLGIPTINWNSTYTGLAMGMMEIWNLGKFRVV